MGYTYVTCSQTVGEVDTDMVPVSNDLTASVGGDVEGSSVEDPYR